MLAAVLGNIAVSLWNKHVWGEVDKMLDKVKKQTKKRLKTKRRLKNE